jgi:N-dimethylarginine dimethylaminohydrolase
MPKQQKHFLMCPPTYFTVNYEINPWMDSKRFTDNPLARKQWQTLHDAYLAAGHRVSLVEPSPDWPDMVFAANGATVVAGKAYGVKFAHAERSGEAELYLEWFRRNGYQAVAATQTNEGEGDFLTIGKRILAASGFRSSLESHRELASVHNLEVVSLELVDPRFYHLDTALAVLESDRVAYFPGAFSAESLGTLEELYPDAILVSEEEAIWLALNATSDGENVFVAAQAPKFAEELRRQGYNPIPIDVSEFLKGGGGIKCCTLEIRE